jgi:hypothetical protein
MWMEKEHSPKLYPRNPRNSRRSQNQCLCYSALATKLAGSIHLSVIRRISAVDIDGVRYPTITHYIVAMEGSEK